MSGARAGEPPGGRVVGEGWDHVAWLVERADGPWIIKRVKDGTIGEAAASVRREAAVMRFVGERLGRWVAGDASAHGIEVTYRFVPGEPLIDLVRAGRVAPAVTTDLVAVIGRVVGAVAALDARAAVADLPVEAGGGRDWLDATVEAIPAVRPHLDRASRARVEAFAATAPPPGPDPADLAFVHNDLGAEHVLVDPATMAVTGVIDWADAAWGDPAADVGRMLRDLGRVALAPMLDGLAGAGGTPHDVTRRAWWYARALAIEDLAYALVEQPGLVAAELDVLGRVFAEAPAD